MGWKTLRVFAGALSVVWAVLWILLCLMTMMVAGPNRDSFFTHYSPLIGVFFLISAIVAMKWNRIGGLILIAEGLAIPMMYPPVNAGNTRGSTMVTAMLFLILPPLLSGGIFLLADLRTRRATPAERQS
jgi:hypothetical protein